MLETEFADLNLKIKYICDFNSEKRGESFENSFQEVFVKNPDELRLEDSNNIFVLITTLFDEEVSDFLKSLNITNFMSARTILNEKINVAEYWDDRYKKGYDTGVQSQGFLLEKQVEYVNEVIYNNNIDNVFELGCGNGKMLSLLHLKNYVGLDISQAAIDLCRKTYAEDKAKKFYTLSEFDVKSSDFDLSLSLGNVISSLPDEEAYIKYMADLFSASSGFVCIFSPDHESERYGHIKARNFSKYVSENFENWRLAEIKETGYTYKKGDPLDAKFFVYKKNF